MQAMQEQIKNEIGIGVAAAAVLAALGGGLLVSAQNNPTSASINGYTKDQCKNGGWKTLGLGFKNQGDCVSYFATGGKNPPAN